MFNLSENINTQKAFIINRSYIVNRIDPEMVLYRKKVSKFNFPVIQLGKLLSKSPQYGANEAGIDRIDAKEPRYIRITDIDEYGNLINEIGKTANVVEEKYILNNDDIIIARSGNTVGKSYIHKSDRVDYKCFFAGYMIRFVTNFELLNPNFLFIYTQLKPYKEWVKAIQRTAGQPNINAEEYKSLEIPLPSLEIQDKFNLIYQTAYNQKLVKENQAKELLKYIDSYLLDELDIPLPLKDSSYSNRTFEVKWSEIAGDRFDAFSFFNSAIKIEGGIYENKKLRELATVNKGQSITSSNVIEGQYPVIAGGKTSPYSHNEYNYDGKTITVSASGAYSGYVWYHNQPIFASDCAVIKSLDENVITMDYLSEILKLKQTEIYGLQQGAGQPHVYPSDLIKLNIPVPPIDIQERITTHIFELREKAKQLEMEAKEVLDNAKQEIENMIIG